MGKELWNYNTVEQTLLFTMCLVLINAIMFQSKQIQNNKRMELGLAAWTFVLIMGSLIYFLVVLFSEIALGLNWLSQERAVRWFGESHSGTGMKTGMADDDDDDDDDKDDIVFQENPSTRNMKAGQTVMNPAS